MSISVVQIFKTFSDEKVKFDEKAPSGFHYKKTLLLLRRGGPRYLWPCYTRYDYPGTEKPQKTWENP